MRIINVWYCITSYFETLILNLELWFELEVQDINSDSKLF